jgi:ribosomal protein S18 acetylase RimI-like enzyme
MLSRNNSDYNHILKHIEVNRASIFFGFDKEPDILQLCKKISENAERFEYWDNNLLIGLFACYYNDTATLTGYITIASVSSDHRNMGIGSELLGNTLRYGFENGFKNIKIEVNKQNHRAIRFYEKNEFAIETQTKKSFIMINSLINL